VAAAERGGPAGVEERVTFIAGPLETREILSPPPANPVRGSGSITFIDRYVEDGFHIMCYRSVTD
jgi:hypothetical protein